MFCNFTYGYICAVVAWGAPAYQLQQEKYHLVMGRQSQLEVQNNLNLLSCKMIFALIEKIICECFYGDVNASVFLVFIQVCDVELVL